MKNKFGQTGVVLLACSVLLAGLCSSSAQSTKMTAVDLELVLAVDISQSMDFEEHTLQRNGYIEAFRHKDVIDALISGPRGRIAVTYMEWAGAFQPTQLIPWTIIDSEKAALSFADKIAAEPVYGEQRTSISTALYEAARLIDENTFSSHRQVIDVSGDGANNAGPPVERARDDVLKRGIIINGLPIMLGKPMEFYDIEHLDRYYKHCVIGGEGAFIAPVFSLKQLSATIRKKLVLEIAGLETRPAGSPGTAPVQYAKADPVMVKKSDPLTRVQLKLPTEKADCFAGEKAMSSMGGFGGFSDQ